jgi:hypothetical protein
MRRLVFSLIWAAAFFLESLALLLGGFFALGLYSRMTGGPASIAFSQHGILLH